ncbi:MAG: phosphatidylserine decarboxylase [Deltaproteobacteria bacterium]|nr:phosphatidylserine decarboxylase [Deltaproteobacteria bacterium]
MEVPGSIILAASLAAAVLFNAYLFWRYFWFFRNPPRKTPEGENIVSPADGRVVYVKRVQAGEGVISIKNRKPASISEIVREDLDRINVLIGVFMSPFDVHYNRVPLSGRVEFVRHRPAEKKNRHMTSMHWRSMLGRLPLYANSPHISENERTVTKIAGAFKGRSLSCHIVQIAGGSVRGIESYVCEGMRVEKGQPLGMIRIGSQVDLVVPWDPPMEITVSPGDRVRAGETVLIK